MDSILWIWIQPFNSNHHQPWLWLWHRSWVQNKKKKDFQPWSLAGAGKEQNESLAAVRSEDMGLILVKSWSLAWSWSWPTMGQISSNSKKAEANCNQQQQSTTPEKPRTGYSSSSSEWEAGTPVDDRHPDEKERLTMCRGRLRDSFRERCQRMQLTRSRFSASMRRKTQGIKVPGGGGRRWRWVWCCL